jgi:chemotaxis protein MotB
VSDTGRISDRLDFGEPDQGWMLTMGDMLTLLLTFFVFLISVSVFKTDEYNRFWLLFNRQPGETAARSQSFRFGLIKGLHLPRLSPEAGDLLDETAELLQNGDFRGTDIYYDEYKISLLISEQLGFAPRSAELSPALQKLVADFAPKLARTPFAVQVEGHSDDRVAPGMDNMELSLQRALGVARALGAAGLERRRIAVAGYGPWRPLGDNRSEEGRRLNRRVEIIVNVKN